MTKCRLPEDKGLSPREAQECKRSATLPCVWFMLSNYKPPTISNYVLSISSQTTKLFFHIPTSASSSKNVRVIFGFLELWSAGVGNHSFNIYTLFLPPMICGLVRFSAFTDEKKIFCHHRPSCLTDYTGSREVCVEHQSLVVSLNSRGGWASSQRVV